LSALGVLEADVVKEQSRTVMIEASRGVEKKLDSVFREMEKEARRILRDEGFSETKQRHERSLAARYKGQSFELQIKTTSGNIAAAFHRAHKARYGYAQEKNVVEIVSARVRSIGVIEKARRRPKVVFRSKIRKAHDFVKTYFDQKQIRAAVYRRRELRQGDTLLTPCIVTEYSATTLIPKEADVVVGNSSELIIETMP
jgi:N-methylhydantoinase A